MGWSNGVMTTPVGLGDLSHALNVGGTTLDLGAIIVSSSTINIWAKYKAFCHSLQAFANDNDYDAARATRNCGMTMKEYTSLASAISDALALPIGGTNWVYDRPTAGQPYEWFRILDFASMDGNHGYDLSAQAPFRMEVLPSPAYTLDVPKITDAAGGLTLDNEITKADLNGDGSNGKTTGYKYYNLNSGINYGIAFVKAGAIIDAKTFTSMPSNVSVPQSVTAVSANTTYDVVVFLTNQTFDWGGSQSSGKYYLAPMPHFTWRMLNSSGLWVNAQFTSSARSAITLTVTNNSGTNRAYTSIGVTANISSAILDTNGTINAGATTQSYTFTKASGDTWPSNQTFTLVFTTAQKQVNVTFQAFEPI